MVSSFADLFLKSIEAPLNALTDLLVKYIYSGYMFTDRMYKLKNFRRNVVTVIDTDSNILSLDPWIEYGEFLCRSVFKIV